MPHNETDLAKKSMDKKMVDRRSHGTRDVFVLRFFCHVRFRPQAGLGDSELIQPCRLPLRSQRPVHHFHGWVAVGIWITQGSPDVRATLGCAM